MHKLKIKAVAFARTPEQLQNSGLSSLFIPFFVAEVQRCMWFAVYIVGGTRPEVYPEVVLNGAATAGNSCVDVKLMIAALPLLPAERDVAAIRWHLNRLVDVVNTRRPTYSQLPCHCILHSCHSPGREVRNKSGDHWNHWWQHQRRTKSQWERWEEEGKYNWWT